MLRSQQNEPGQPILSPRLEPVLSETDEHESDWPETKNPEIGGHETGCHQTEEQWMTAFAAGRTDAFQVLFARYKQPLFGFFRRRVPDPASAEELTQDTFLSLIRTSRSYQPTALFRTYLYSIAFNVLRAHRRKAAFRATFLGVSDGRQEPSVYSSVHDDLAIRQALARVDSTDREILLLREFEQLSYAEIADLLELPLNTVRSRLFRARAALREILAAGNELAAPLLKHFQETL